MLLNLLDTSIRYVRIFHQKCPAHFLFAALEYSMTHAYISQYFVILPRAESFHSIRFHDVLSLYISYGLRRIKYQLFE